MIAIIGRGNVASHLFTAIKEKMPVCLVNPHTLEDLPANPEIILISVTDSAINEVVEKLPDTSAIIAHTAGSVKMEAVKGKSPHYGVFYPLQTFTKNVKLDYSQIPVFIEASSPIASAKLKDLARCFSTHVHEADSETRKKLHLASVFACNFTNALADIADSLLKENGLDFSTLSPLLQQTVEKLQNLPPHEAQTGPAVRGDFKIINNHLSMLDNHPELQQIYSMLSDYILKKHKAL